MADGHGDWDGFLCPFVPFVDVDIGSADGGFLDLDKDVHGAEFWFRDVFEPKSFFSFRFYECFHNIVNILDQRLSLGLFN